MAFEREQIYSRLSGDNRGVVSEHIPQGLTGDMKTTRAVRARVESAKRRRAMLRVKL
jgi:hypothetical protein